MNNYRVEPPLPLFAYQVASDARREYEAALDHLAGLRRKMEALQRAGMYPGVPHEQWQDRNGTGEKNYLYMVFRQAQGRLVETFEGPGGKKKLYVGCDEQKIAQARAMAKRRVEWLALEKAAKDLERWLDTRRSEFRQIERFAGTWPAYNHDVDM